MRQKKYRMEFSLVHLKFCYVSIIHTNIATKQKKGGQFHKKGGKKADNCDYKTFRMNVSYAKLNFNHIEHC